MVEFLPSKQGVAGSSPVSRSNNMRVNNMYYLTTEGMQMISENQIKTFIVTVNGKEYQISALDKDEALCTAYRKYHLGKVNVFNDILWHLGTTKEVVSIIEKTY